jgi:uncharacterized protein YecT (DUF1311 family)
MRTYLLTTVATFVVLAAGVAWAGPAATQPSKPAAAWIKLSADEAWYKDHKQPEQVFSGTLMRHKEPGASTLMRSHSYRLGDRFLYPGQQRPELDKLLYKKVEIKGKPYDVNLEGQAVKEIWAAAIRPVAELATQAAARPISFETYNGYFVSNKFEPDAPASFVVIKDRKAFDDVFGTAMVMGDKSHRLPADFFESKAVSRIVLAVVKRGHAVWQFKVKDVSERAGTLILSYTATAGKESSATFASPLIVAVPGGVYAGVRFEENGQLAKRIEIAWAEIKQDAGRFAETADAELNMVYKQLMAALDKEEKQRLVAAQRAWIAFRDAECEFEANYTGSGTDRAVNHPFAAQHLTAARTADLREILDERDR